MFATHSIDGNEKVIMSRSRENTSRSKDPDIRCFALGWLVPVRILLWRPRHSCCDWRSYSTTRNRIFVLANTIPTHQSARLSRCLGAVELHTGDTCWYNFIYYSWWMTLTEGYVWKRTWGIGWQRFVTCHRKYVIVQLGKWADAVSWCVVFQIGKLELYCLRNP